VNSYHAPRLRRPAGGRGHCPPEPAGGRPDIKSEKLSITPPAPLDAELADFVNTVRARRAPLIDGRTGLEALRVALMVKERIAACQP